MDLHAFIAERYYASCVNIVEVLNSIEASQIAGNVIIVDLEGLSFSTMMHLAQPYFLKLWKSIFRDCIPYRMTGMHYINDPEYFNIFLKIARQLFRKKLQERIFVHGNDLTSLHKYVSPEILPEEYGGKQGSWTECSNTFLSKYFTYDDYIDNLNKYGYTGETLKNLRQKSAEPIQDDSADLSVRL